MQNEDKSKRIVYIQSLEEIETPPKCNSVMAIISYRCPHCRKFLDWLNNAYQPKIDIIFYIVQDNISKTLFYKLKDEFDVKDVPTFIFNNIINGNSEKTSGFNESLDVSIDNFFKN